MLPDGKTAGLIALQNSMYLFSDAEALAATTF